MTWRDLIQLTLEDLGVVGQAQPAKPNDVESMRLRLNDWIDFLKTQKQAIYQIARTTWALNTATSYSIGTGGTINVARPPGPQFIDGFAYIDNNVTTPYEYPLGPPMTDQEWQGLSYKTLQATIPSRMYYDKGSYPLGAVNVWPIPTQSNLLGVIYSGVPVDEIAGTAAALAATIALPPGYRLYLRLGLQIHAAGGFRVQIPQETMLLWPSAQAAVKRTNEVLEEIGFGVAGRLFGRSDQGSNIYTGKA